MGISGALRRHVTTHPVDTVPALKSALALGEPVPKYSTQLSRLIRLMSALPRAGVKLPPVAELRRLRKSLEVLLLRESPKKAEKASGAQISSLIRAAERQEVFAVPLALMIPAGARFQDVARIRAEDVEELNREGVLTYRVFQAKNVRRRQHQRWLSMHLPPRLAPALARRILTCPAGRNLVEVSYQRFLRWMKQAPGCRTLSTYSIRRFVLNTMALGVSTLSELQAITLHRNAEQLRWYLDAPLADEVKAQLSATSWVRGT